MLTTLAARYPVPTYFLCFTALTLLASCAPPKATGVGEWDGRKHTITAETKPGKGFSDIYYIVAIDGDNVINAHIPRSDQVIENGSLSAVAHGTHAGHRVDAKFTQTANFDRTYFSHQIRIDGELVAVISP